MPHKKVVHPAPAPRIREANADLQAKLNSANNTIAKQIEKIQEITDENKQLNHSYSELSKAYDTLHQAKEHLVVECASLKKELEKYQPFSKEKIDAAMASAKPLGFHIHLVKTEEPKPIIRKLLYIEKNEDDYTVKDGEVAQNGNAVGHTVETLDIELLEMMKPVIRHIKTSAGGSEYFVEVTLTEA